MWLAGAWQLPWPASCAPLRGVRPQGVVFNAHFLAYFDIAITELFRAAFDTVGGYQGMVERSGLEFVVAEAGLRYHGPAHFDDELTVEIALTRLGTTSITTSYRVLRDGELLVDGTLRHVLVDPKGLFGRERGRRPRSRIGCGGLAAYVAE